MTFTLLYMVNHVFVNILWCLNILS